jgi:predicted nucleotidyltransferase
VTPEEIASRLADDPAMAGVRLLIQHGSRARGDHHPRSDWDFGAVYDDSGADPGALVTALSRAVGSDEVDLTDLRRASALLRYRAARDGVLVCERADGDFLAFRLEAVRYWCDAGPVIQAAQRDVLAELR